MKIKILLADDHKILRNGLSALIEKQENLELIGEVENGQKAVQLTCELKPDIVIMDIIMPDLNGIEATQQIIAKTTGVKVIALSVHSDKRFVAGMLKAGASGYLLKENTFEELVKAVHTVIEGNIYISPATINIIVEDYIRNLPNDAQSENNLLTAREHNVLLLLVEGKNMKQIASQLNISIKTVDIHRRHFMEKLGIQSIVELTKFAIRTGLVSMEP